MVTSHLERFLDITELQTNPNYVSNLLKTVHSKNITIEEWNMFVLQFEALVSRNADVYIGFDAVLKDIKELKIQIESGGSGGGGTVLPVYEGPYTVTPTAYAQQVLATQHTSVMHNITVEAVPIEEVSNTRGGLTVTIA